MSSSTAGSSNSSRYLDFDEYVDLKLQKTRSSIKTTDILVALAGVGAMFLGYLLLFVVFDQWVVPGGFGIGLRWTLLSTLLVLTAAWLTWKVGLPYLRTVNRLFAAKEIERSDPELKSNLLNLIDLRASGRHVDPAILRALEKNAAVGLQKIDVAQAIDHRPLMRMAYVLLAVVVVFCLYALFSPKKISNSIWRSLLPASDLSVSTRTEIINVQPGDITVLARESVPVSADIAGEVPDKVWLHYTTADGKFRNEPVELRTEGEGPTRFKGFLRGENGQGLLQDLTYVVHAGDAVSREYRITVNQAPNATVDRVRIQFPAYMKLDTAEQVGGQIDSWEGTKVALTAHTNMPVKSAKIELLDSRETGPTGEEISLSVSGDGLQLTTSWTLAIRSDATSAKFYRIQCLTESGATDPSPTLYTLNIRPDLPPEVSLLEPVRDLEVPANAIVPLLIEARDPDFELSHINLHVKTNGQLVHKAPLSEGRKQRLLLKHDLELDRLRVKPGDVVEFWVQAFDNKQPRPNSKVTPELRLKIVAPVTEKEAQKKADEDRSNRDQRQKEAEQEQNPGARGEQQSPKDDSGDEPRGAQEPKQPDQQPMPKNQGGEEASNDQKGKTGNDVKPNSNGDAQGQGQGDQKGKQDQQSSDGGTGDKSKNQPLPSNGDGDQEALERLIKNELNKDKNQNKDQGKTDKSEKGSEQKKTNEQNNGGSEANSSNSDTGSPSKSNSANKEQTNPGTENKTPQGANPPKKSSGEPTGNDDPSDKPDPTQQPMPKGDSTKPDALNPPMGNRDKTADQKQGAAPDKSNPDNKTPKGPMDKGPMDRGPKPSPTDGSDPMNGDGDKTKSDEMNNADKPGPKTKTEPGPNPQVGDKTEQKPGPDGGNETPADKAPPNGDKPAKEATDKQGSGTKTEGSSPMKDGMGDEKKGPADGPQEQTGDSPNAEQKKGDGSETGTAKPDRDPNSKATPSNNPDLQRDPMEKAETKPGAPKANDAKNPAKNGSDKNVKSPKPTKAGEKPEKIDQQTGDEEKSPPGQNEQKRQGDPNAANEKMKGPGQKEQRSKTGSGGEGGTSKEDSQGDPGSKTPGEGDGADQPGNQQPTDKKTDQQPGGKNQPGDGSKTEEGGEKKEGGDKKQGAGKDKKDKKEQGKPSDQGGGGKSDKQNGGEQKSGEGQKSDQQGGESGGESAGGSEGQGGKGGSSSKGGGGSAGKPGNGIPGGGGQADGPDGDSKGGTPSAVNDGEEANLEFKKQATELVLKRLQDGLERGEIDPELKEKLGWTDDQMRQFAERLSKQLKDAKSTDETPESQARRLQFEEMLKSLDVNKSGAKRQGEKSPQREVDQLDTRRGTVPNEYRSAYDRFTREVTRQKSKPAQK